jgi:hypothetical protein
VLVELVRDRVGDAEHECRQLAPERADEQQPEDRVLDRVRQLPEHEIPAAEARPEIWNGREREDHRRPEDDRKPEPERGRRRHECDGRLAPQTEHGEGTRCKSGTVPPL